MGAHKWLRQKLVFQGVHLYGAHNGHTEIPSSEDTTWRCYWKILSAYNNVKCGCYKLTVLSAVVAAKEMPLPSPGVSILEAYNIHLQNIKSMQVWKISILPHRGD